MKTALSNLMGNSFKRTKYSTTKLFSLFALLLMLGLNGVKSQTTLAAGDIIITGVQASSTPDAFGFVTLKDLAAGTVIYFTDNGWNNTTGAFRGVTVSAAAGNEGVCKFTVNSGNTILAGSYVQAYETNSIWTWTTSGAIGAGGSYSQLSLAQGTSGNSDQVYAVQSSSSSNPLFLTSGVTLTPLYVFDATNGFEDASSANNGNVISSAGTSGGLLSGSITTAANTAFTFNAGGSSINFYSINTGAGGFSTARTKAQWLTYFGSVSNYSLTTSTSTLPPAYSSGPMNTLADEPTSTSTALNTTGTTPTSLSVGWTNPVSNGGSNRIVVLRANATTAVPPTDNTTYTTTSTFGSGTGSQLTGTGNYVIYNGLGTSVTGITVTANTAYQVDIYEFNGGGASTGLKENYFATAANLSFTTPSAGTISLNNNTQITSGNINQGATDQILSRFYVAATGSNATLNALSFTAGGTFTAGNITNFKLYTSSSNSFPGGTALSTVSATSIANAGTVTFGTLSQSCPTSGNTYFWITADVSGTATAGNTVSVPSLTSSNFTFATGTPTGTITAGGAQTFQVLTPSIAISANHPAAGNLNQNATNQNIGSIALAVTTTGATLNSVTFTTAGTYQTSDLVASSFKLYYTTTNTFSTGTQLGSAQAVVASGNTITFSSLSQSIGSSVTGYLWLTVDVAYNANTSRNINVATTAFSNITFAAGTKTGTDPVAAGNTMSFAAVTPSVAIAPISVAAGNIQVNTTSNILANLSFTVTTNTTNLTGVTFNTDATNTYTASDITNFKLWYSTSNTFNGAAQIGTTVTSISSAGGTIVFTPTQNILLGTTGYLWLTADIASGATSTRTINIATTAYSNFIFDNGASISGTGPVSAFGLQTIVTAVNKYITGIQTWNTSNANWATTAGGSYNTTWGSGNIANFEGTSANITLSGTQTASGLNFNQTTTTNTIIAGGTGITLSGTPSILMGNSAINQVNYINSAVNASSLVIVGLNNSATGLAILNFGGSNTFTSGLQISASTVSRLNFNSASAAGTGGITLNANRVRFTNSGTANDFASSSTVVSIPALTLNITGSPYKAISFGATANSNMSSLNYDGIISGTLDTVYVGNDVTAAGGGNASTIFNAANTYSAATVFNANAAASLKLGVDNALPITTTLYFNKGNGGLNTNNFNQKVASIADGTNSGTPGGIVLSSTKVFSIEGSTSNSYGGVISGAGALTLTSSNSGTQTLTGTNTYTGGTNINGGTLTLGVSSTLASMGAVTLNGGILNFGGAFTQTIGALTLTSGNITGATGTLTPSSMDVSAGTMDVILAGTGSMTKNTSGTVFLTNGSNTYSGGTTINGGIISVNGANRLGGTSVAVTINAGTFQLTTSSITSARVFNFNNSASTFDVASGISYTNTTATYTGTGILNKTGNGTLTFQTSNTNPQTYNGLNIKAGTVSIGKETDLGSVPGTTNASYLLLDGGTLLDSNTITIDSKRGVVLGTGGGTINVLSTKTLTYGGIIADNSGAGSLSKTGAGILSLTGTSNSYTGATTITAGELNLNPSANATFASQIILNGGTLSTTSITATRTFTSSSTLNLAASSTIALGSNAHTLTFANSSSITWAGTTLTITGWTGSAGSSGTAGKIILGAGGLTSGQLAKINFTGYSNGAMIVSGELVPYLTSSPTISTSGSLSAVNTTYGTASAAPTTFTASGFNLTADITITAPSGYEISKTSGGASGYANSQTLVQSSGTVANTTIYLRLTSNATVVGSPYTGNITLQSAGATDVNVATVSSTVATATLTITGLTANAKTYDRSTSVSVTGTAAFSGLMNSESFTPTGTVTWAFADALAGTNKTLSRTGSYATPSSNYTVTQPSLTASINALTLTTSGTAAITSKTYDRTTTATVAGLSLTNVISGDVVTITGTYNDKTVNTGKAVTLSLSGADNANYSWTAPTGVTGNITAAILTITSPAVTSKSYDGTNSATITGTLSGIISGDVVTLVGTGTYASISVGTGISVTSTSTLSGADAGNYTLTQPTGLTGNITTAVPTTIVTFPSSWTGTPTSAASTSQNSNINNTVTVTRGSGLTGTSSTTRFSSSGWSQASSLSLSGNNSYLTFTLTAKSGYYISLNAGTLNFSLGSSGSGPTKYGVYTSVGGFTNTSAQIGSDLTTASTSVTFPSTGYDNLSTIEIRIYGWGATASGGTGGFASMNLTGILTAIPTNNWIGGTSNWNNSSNWGLGTVPLTTDNVTISTGNPKMDVDYTVSATSSLTISGTGSLTLNAGKTLTIAGVADFGAKSVTLKSDVTGTASIGKITGTLSNATNVTIERFISQSGRRWRYICAPVTGQTLADWGTKFYITGPGTPGATVGSQNSNGYATTRSNILGYNNASTTPSSVRIYNRTTSGSIENGWANPASNMATALTPGVGYRAFIRGPITGNYATDTAVIGYFDVNGAAPTQSSFTFSQTGGITSGVNAGSVSMPINSTGTGAAGAFNTSTDGWNLIGNPYPCAFDWVAFWAAGTNRTNIGTAIHVFDATANSYKSYSTQSASGTLTSGIIPSGSAFFVQATGTGASLTFTETFKTSSAPISLHKKGAVSDELHIKYYKDSTESDEYILKMIDGATLQKDDYDITKLKNDNLNLSSYGNDSINLTLSSIPFVTEEIKISLNVEATRKGTYNFDFNTINDFDNSITLFLLDKFTQKTIDIRKNPIYTFVMDSMPHQWGKDRFVLILNAVSTTTGIANESNITNTKMLVYPNPASDVLNISINNANFKNSIISIFNISGNEVLNSTMNGASTQLNIESLSNGVYFVKVKNENGFDRTVKFIK